MTKQKRIFLGLGSNIGEREEHLRQATLRIAEITRTSILKLSSIYETEPVGEQSQNTFLNAVLEVHSSLNPFDLLQSLQQIENEMGRVPVKKWGPRVIDLDILLFGNLQINHPKLIIPHPQLKHRRFVLEPLCEIAPDFIINGDGRTIADILCVCCDTHWVKYFTRPEIILPNIHEEAL